MRLRVGVGDRRFHAQRMRELTGLDVGEGQARVLLGDLQAHRGELAREQGRAVSEDEAAPSWLHDVLDPGHAPRPTPRSTTSAPPCRPGATCSRCAGCSPRRPGTTWAPRRALTELAERAPTDSAARALVADTRNDLPVVPPDAP